MVDGYSEAGLEAVEGRPVGAVLVPPLAEEQSVLVEEEMSLHGLEPGQLLHPHRCPFVADPHAEAPLEDYTTQLAEITLSPRREHKEKCFQPQEIHHDTHIYFKALILFAFIDASRNLVA